MGQRYNVSNVLLILALLLTLMSPAKAAGCAEDPFVDPVNDLCNPLRYIPSKVLTLIALVVFNVVAISQTLMTMKFGGKYMLAMVIGEFFFCIGFGLRFGFSYFPHSLALYIPHNLFIILSPCGFIAADYVLLGRLARWLKCESRLLIPAHRITRVFVFSDVTTFLIQATGGSITASLNSNTIQIGSKIVLVGLALQLTSFLVFTFVFVVFMYRVYKREDRVWRRDVDKSLFRDWRMLAGALFVSCIGILIRSIFRTVEMGEGFTSHLSTTESYFYALDVLPLFIAVVVYVPFWPGRFIPDKEGMEPIRTYDDSDRVVENISLSATPKP